MPNYKQTDLNGSKWNRCYNIRIENFLGTPPRVTFSEETIFDIAGSNINKHSRELDLLVKDPSVEIVLRDINTLEPTSQTMTLGQLYQAILSVYLKVAEERDAMEVASQSTTIVSGTF